MRRSDGDILIPWKIILPAALAGKLDLMLMDPIHSKPIYGARARLFELLAEHWVALQEGRTPPPMPSLEQLRSAR